MHFFIQCNLDCDDDSDGIKCTDGTCISKAFNNDGIVNCPPPEFSDEPPIISNPPESNNTDIIISALTSLIFTLVGVGSCLWLCWNIKDCFIAEVTQSATAHGGNRRENSRSNRTNDLEMPSGSSNNEPNAPPIDEKEDKPPSYDSLFPKPNSTDS